MPQKCETISYYCPTPYREPGKRASIPQTIWRSAIMHLKPYPKLQDKELHQERVQDGTQNCHMDQRGVLGTEWGVRQACSQMALPGNGTANRCPLSVISTNTLHCTTSNSAPPSRSSGNFFSSWTHKSKAVSSVATLTSSLFVLSSSMGLENEGPLRIYQGEEREGSLDIWAVIKPGNTKEKIAIFTAQKCNHVDADGNDNTPEREGITSDMRVAPMKNKGCWDGDWSVAKRRKRSGNPEKPRSLEPLAQKPEIRTSPAMPNENPDPRGVVAEELVRTDGEECVKTLSVVEMVAYLEQRANEQQVDLKPHSLRSSSTITLSKYGLLLQPQEIVTKGPQPPDVHDEEESVRVLDMVAKLESQCLSRQSFRDGGNLSRNNSLRRRVGRVLLAGPGTFSVPSQPALTGLPQDERVQSGTDGRPSDLDQPSGPWVASLPLSTESLGCLVSCARVQREGKNIAEKDTCATVGTVDELQRLNSQANTEVKDCREEPPPGMLFFAQSPHRALQEQKQLTVFDNIPASQNKEHCSNDQKSEHAVALPLRHALGPLSAKGSSTEENMDRLRSTDEEEEEMEEVVGVFNQDPVPLPFRRIVSHEFLETRFKIQLLLEPQQYMAFLPHHIILKIFCLLPTESLAALKCTCHYFKFIIETYGVRPADSLWVSDPRYKDDPCKQCKKRYGQGDVSLCRWHHKPYCQALPYGPGYWMCCRESQKDTPGCNVGLHDNRWVPAFHSITMPIYRRSTDSEEDL